MQNNIPFPQADDFNKIIAIVNISKKEDLNNNELIKIILGEISDRQVNYYISAASFLGIIAIEKRKRIFTEFGIYLRQINSVLQEVELISAILSLPVFGKVFVLKKMIGEQNVNDIASLIKEIYPNYSDAICNRRAQTVLKWVEWILDKLPN